MTTKQYVLLTGGTSGIGYELARIFAQNGHNLILVARSAEELDECRRVLEAYETDIVTIAADLSKREAAFALCRDISQRGLPVHILVNDAGQGLFGKFQDTDLERELDIIDLNIAALVILTKHFLKEMLPRKEGRVLNLASIASKLPGPWQSVYHGTKAFVLSFSEAIREELRDTGITVTALMPGVTDTDFFHKADMEESRAVQDKSAMADPADVARDGYEALMSGKDKVISGLKNKIQIAQSNLTPDAVVAHRMAEQQKPADKEKK